MDEVSIWRMVGEERAEILVFLRDLTPAQWNALSLCEGWRVRDVAVHLLVDEPIRELGWPRAVAMAAARGFSVDRINAWVVEHYAGRDTAEIVAIWQRSLAPGRFARFAGPADCLRAGVIHHQDMRRPLGVPRSIPAERLACVLDHIVTKKGSVNLGSHDRATGFRLRATDMDWSSGDGPEVSGPGEALVMAVAGRASALADLRGDGVQLLAGRSPAHRVLQRRL